MDSVQDTAHHTMLDAALELSEQGFHVIPLGAPGEYPPTHVIDRAGGDISEAKKRWPKTPRTAWAKYQKVAPTDEEIRQWWTRAPNANIGIVTGVKVVVVDADSEESAQWVKDNLTRTPWRVKTARGMHFYYQADDKVIIKNSANEKRKVDVRGIGGQVCAPPSVHWTKILYLWDIDEEWGATSYLDLPPLTNSDLTKINGVNQQSQDADDLGDLSAIKDRATGEKVNRGERNNAAASLAGQYIQEGMSIVEIEQKLKQWNQENPDPLPDAEIRTVTASVAATHTRNNPDQPVPVIPPPAQNKGLNLLDWTASRYNGEPEPIKWLVEDMIPAGKPVVIAAMGDVGKSMLMLDLAVSVATGREDCALGGKISHNGTAVVITAEDDYQEVLRRIAAIDQDNRRLQFPEKLIIVPLPDAGGPFQIVVARQGRPEVTKEYKHIEQQLLAIDDLAMVVFDPMQTFVAADITADATAGQFVCSLASELAAETKAAIIFTHHMRKGSKPIETAADARDAIRGTTALVDGVRCVYALWQAPEKYAANACQELNTEYTRNKVVRGAVVKSNSPADLKLKTYLRNDSGLLIDRTEELTNEELEFDEQTGTYNALTEPDKLTKDQSERLRTAHTWIRTEESIGRITLIHRLSKLYKKSERTIIRDLDILTDHYPDITKNNTGYTTAFDYTPPKNILLADRTEGETEATENQDTEQT